jgi:hypothetical protein
MNCAIGRGMLGTRNVYLFSNKNSLCIDRNKQQQKKCVDVYGGAENINYGYGY